MVSDSYRQTSNDVAIIGVDGLAPEDISAFDFDGEWEPLAIETVAHTAPSWNAIFTGRERDGVYDFFKVPDDESASGEMASNTDEMWSYDELRTDDYVWERADVDVEVVSAPVVLPTFSTLADPPEDDLTWCTTRAENARSIGVLTDLTLAEERVITVFPQPDKLHHLVDRPDDYTAADRRRQMAQLQASVRTLTSAFDRWLLLSDHGRPAQAEHPFEDRDLWVASHTEPGVIRSNCAETAGLTNCTVYDEIVELLGGSP